MQPTAVAEAESSADASHAPAPWRVADLPPAPPWRGLQVLGAIGPGIIMLGVSVGSGEWLLGPAAFVRYGPTLLWVCLVAVLLQTVFNVELMRYTMATGEPVSTGFMRTAPGGRFWAVLYALLYFLQVGWPGWAGAAAGAVFFLFTGRLGLTSDGGMIYLTGILLLLLCVAILSFGRQIERTLEALNWIFIIFIFSGLVLLCVAFVPLRTWLTTVAGFAAFDASVGHFAPLPHGADWLLIGAFAGYSGAGGVVNLMLSNWTRDRGFGMGRLGGYIPGVIGGRRRDMPPAGFMFPRTARNLAHWRDWMRVAHIDQWLLFAPGALLAMLLLAMLYLTFVQPGADIRDLAIAARLADAMAGRGNVALTFSVALIGAWLLFKTQLDILDGAVRAVTDLAWAGSRRVRKWRGGDVRAVYYVVLVAVVLWGVLALRLTKPIILLQIGANVAGLATAVASLHLLRLNTTRLPVELRPALWRRVCLVLIAAFYGAFTWLWLMGGLTPDPARGFIFNIARYFG